MFSFRSEGFDSIPLPPDVSFEEAFAQFDAVSNAYYVLSRSDEEYTQCGGSSSTECTVEVRLEGPAGTFIQSVIGKDAGARDLDARLSGKNSQVERGEVLALEDAIELFSRFHAGDDFPAGYTLRDRFPAQPSSQPAPPEDQVEHEDEARQGLPRWLDKDDAANPFGVGGVDCDSFVRSLVSTSIDQQIAASFLTQRDATGTEHAGLLPPNATVLVCDLSYPHTGLASDGALFKASTMEEKWDIYRHANRLYFCRSWTGSLQLVAEFHASGSALTVQRVWADPEASRQQSSYPVRQVDYLIQSHVLGRNLPHPLPAALPRDAMQVAQFSFSAYGRMCRFGTFEGTIPIGHAESPTVPDSGKG